MTADENAIRGLNEAYIQAFLMSDASWYEEHLTQDFTFTDGRGVVVDRATFLRDTKSGTDVVDYDLHEVRVRIFGDAALVNALGTFKRTDGSTGQNRYTDVYVRAGNEWKAVSAQVTPVAVAVITA
jgi:ketosteroid isomerase-like protein